MNVQSRTWYCECSDRHAARCGGATLQKTVMMKSSCELKLS